jgi:hypothetical protein
MLIIALVLAVIGLVSLVTAVVTSNELVAWVCIGASVVGVILLIVDAVRDRQHREPDSEPPSSDEPDGSGAGAVLAAPAVAAAGVPDDVSDAAVTPAEPEFDAEYPEEEPFVDEGGDPGEAEAGEADLSESALGDDYPEEFISDEPDADTFSDDEPEYPESAEEAAIHPLDEDGAQGTEAR